MPPSSSETFLTCPRALRHQQLADLGRAGEAELPHDRVRRQLAADRGASAAEPVTTERMPRGTPARSASSASASAESGVCSAGLSDHRAAGGERGRRLAGDHRRREVPGRDAGGDADRLLRDHDPHAVGGRRDHVAVGALRLLAEPLQERRRRRRSRPSTRRAACPARSSGAARGRRCARAAGRASGAARARARFAVFARQAGCAASAASIARRVSAAPQRGTSASTSPVAGFSHLERLAGVGVDPCAVDVGPGAEELGVVEREHLP